MKCQKSLLVTIADKKYVQQAKALFSSVYWNAGWKGDYMLLSHEIPEKELKWFRDKGIIVKKCNPLRKGIYNKMHPSMLDKLYLFTPEFKKWKKIIYLDADIIVRGSLNFLTRLKKGFWAVRDPDRLKLKDNFISKTAKKCFLISNTKYNLSETSFNAGVFTFDSSIIKQESFSKLVDLMNQCEELSHLGDQLILNLYFYNLWKELPLIYNIFYNSSQNTYLLSRNRLKGIIIHSNWQPKFWSKENPLYFEWLDNLKRANKIDLKKPRIIREDEMKRYNQYLNLRMLFLAPIRASIFNSLKRIDQLIGKIGILINKRYPKIYQKVRIRK